MQAKKSKLHFTSQVLALVICWVITPVYGQAPHSGSMQLPTYRIYLDADQTNSESSGKSIELGIRAALAENNWKLGEFPVELIIKDHHGSSPRSKLHLVQFLEDPYALALFGGLHSPPLLASRDFINNNDILTLVPWAAATPITRYPSSENWIFRLSVDDSKASQVLVNNAIKDSGFKQPFLLLEDTGWGKANEITMSKALSEEGITSQGLHYFQWGIGQHEARTLLENAISKGADGFILVANAPEGVTFANAMLTLDIDRQRPIRSHWGITGGKFFDTIGSANVSKLDLQFIQTRFSFFDTPLSALAHGALKSAASQLGQSEITAKDIKAPSGFIHAYDLSKILIEAANKTQLTGSAKTDRQALRTALETLNSPIEGLIKTYLNPFTIFSDSNIDAHEALNISDFVMAKYDEQGNIRVIPTFIRKFK